jgi:hypothetical protein
MKLFVSLATCNVFSLIDSVMESLLKNTQVNFDLSIFDNHSTDGTYDKLQSWLTPERTKGSSLSQHWIGRSPTLTPSVDCINSTFIPFFSNPFQYSMVAKLDHDYCVPETWDITIQGLFNNNPHLQLLCPGVHESTPKGFQYLSQGHNPEMTSTLLWDTQAYLATELYHYTGIAGYCHCFRPETLVKELQYRAMNHGAVFGSEDADWSLRCGSTVQKAYIPSLKGFHLSKQDVGSLEDAWKGSATFLGTKLPLEEWMKQNHPDVYEKHYKYYEV